MSDDPKYDGAGDNKSNTKASSTELVADAEAATLTAISTYFEVPILPSFVKNVMSAAGALVTAALAVPTAYLEAWAQGIRAEASAKETVVKGRGVEPWRYRKSSRRWSIENSISRTIFENRKSVSSRADSVGIAGLLQTFVCENEEGLSTALYTQPRTPLR